MSQTWTADIFDGTHTAEADLANMEANFQSLKSFFSGSVAPSSPVAFQPWADTVKYVPKYRNAADTDWVGLMIADGSQKVWLYLNAAIGGWAVDATVSDRVLSLKGGSVYTSGGAGAGVSQVSGYDHYHQWFDLETAAAPTYYTQHSFDSGGTKVELPTVARSTGYALAQVLAADALGECWTGPVIVVTSTYVPAAAVGTLQYLDL